MTGRTAKRRTASAPRRATKKLSGEDRRNSILDAATEVFAERGFEGTKTYQIAKAAKVSEALMYRHFESKTVLYRAVLRKLIRMQNTTYSQLRAEVTGAAGLIETFDKWMRHSYLGGSDANAQSMRILFGSLASGGNYARLIYRRAARLALRGMAGSLEEAREAGELTGRCLNPRNAAAFVEHVGSMIFVARMPDRPLVEYGGEPEEVIRDAVYFTARGIGLAEAVVDRFYATRIEDKAPAAFEA